MPTDEDRRRGREQKAKKREKNRARGLCSNCNSPVAPGRTKCAKHLSKDRIAHQSAAERRIAAGECRDCGKKHEGKYQRCLPCRLDRSAWNAARYRGYVGPSYRDPASVGQQDGSIRTVEVGEA